MGKGRISAMTMPRRTLYRIATRFLQRRTSLLARRPKHRRRSLKVSVNRPPHRSSKQRSSSYQQLSTRYSFRAQWLLKSALSNLRCRTARIHRSSLGRNWGGRSSRRLRRWSTRLRSRSRSRSNSSRRLIRTALKASHRKVGNAPNRPRRSSNHVLLRVVRGKSSRRKSRSRSKSTTHNWKTANTFSSTNTTSRNLDNSTLNGPKPKSLSSSNSYGRSIHKSVDSTTKRLLKRRGEWRSKWPIRLNRNGRFRAKSILVLRSAVNSWRDRR